ncbi:uncharacterized protein LOC124646990 [Lolium rigidum]|uniref:uncharacterized protein LOC124646990 n=1 Tax=Lolium rigidum TaxID=89674 RepID=UPI001F5DC6AD|nr:uncharacterized protein LOC124646990 [Lolium rigidum]
MDQGVDSILSRLSRSSGYYQRKTAYDVSLKEDSWPQEALDLVSGSTSKIVEKLEPLVHNFRFYCVLETKVQGRFQGSPVVIKYRVPKKAALQQAYSTPVLPFDILAERPPQRKLELAKIIVGKYRPLASVVSFVGAFIYLVASPSKYGAAKGSKKGR